MRMAVPDLISNSYFPAIAAVELGFCAAEGLDMQLDLLYPVPTTMAALRDGAAELIKRDLPYYDPTISAAVVNQLQDFARHVGLLAAPVPYEQVVAVEFRHLWES